MCPCVTNIRWLLFSMHIATDPAPPNHALLSHRWSNHIQPPDLAAAKPVTAVTLRKWPPKCKHSNSTQFLGPPPGNLDLSPDLSPSHLRFSSGATAVIRHSQTTSATSSWNSLKKISASSVENPWPRAVEVKFWYKPLIKYTDLPTLRAGPPSPITNGVKTVKTLPETNGLPLKTGLNSPKGNYQ